jgi:hypothetical protein
MPTGIIQLGFNNVNAIQNTLEPVIFKVLSVPGSLLNVYRLDLLAAKLFIGLALISSNK